MVKRLKWWEGEYVERQRLNEAADELFALNASQGQTSEQLARLFRLDQDQGREIARLEATVMALIELMVESGVVGEQQVVERVDAALAELEQQERARAEAEQRKAEREEVRNPFVIAPRK